MMISKSITYFKNERITKTYYMPYFMHTCNRTSHARITGNLSKYIVQATTDHQLTESATHITKLVMPSLVRLQIAHRPMGNDNTESRGQQLIRLFFSTKLVLTFAYPLCRSSSGYLPTYYTTVEDANKRMIDLQRAS